MEGTIVINDSNIKKILLNLEITFLLTSLIIKKRIISFKIANKESIDELKGSQEKNIECMSIRKKEKNIIKV
jgi:hypothetical protein